ncbi:MAG: hypothetical protein ABI878_00810 [Acidobacteriota bacterium]
MATITDRLGRRGVALLSLLLVSIVIGFLIKFEQIAILYVLATLSLVVLLLVVGFADLENVGVDGDHGLGPGTE